MRYRAAPRPAFAVVCEAMVNLPRETVHYNRVHYNRTFARATCGWHGSPVALGVRYQTNRMRPQADCCTQTLTAGTERTHFPAPRRWYLVDLLGGRSRLSEFLGGTRDLSKSQIVRLRDALGIPADLLLPV